MIRAVPDLYSASVQSWITEYMIMALLALSLPWDEQQILEVFESSFNLNTEQRKLNTASSWFLTEK